MTLAPNLTPVQASAPDIAGRVALILGALAALVAYRFLKDPRFQSLILPLWTRITRTATRFGRLMARIAVNRAPKPRPIRPRHRQKTDAARPPSPFPTGHAWLLVAIPYDAAGYASQLSAVLAEPGTIALFAAYPAAARLLNPLARMLGMPPIAPKRPAPIRRPLAASPAAAPDPALLAPPPAPARTASTTTAPARSGQPAAAAASPNPPDSTAPTHAHNITISN